MFLAMLTSDLFCAVVDAEAIGVSVSPAAYHVHLSTSLLTLSFLLVLFLRGWKRIGSEVTEVLQETDLRALVRICFIFLPLLSLTDQRAESFAPPCCLRDERRLVRRVGVLRAYLLLRYRPRSTSRR
jgi:hypothetical protein